MNLFKQVRAVSRDDTLHTCLFTNSVHTEEIVYAYKEWAMIELIFLLSLLVVRRMRREHIRTMSKNADVCSLEVSSTFHPCFINFFAVCYLKGRAHFITGRFCLSSPVLSPLGILPSVFSLPQRLI